MPHDTPLLLRFFAKLVLDILPAALASVIGGFLFSHYEFGRAAAPAPAAAQHAVASAEMMKLVRDEHALVVDFLNAEMAAEKRRAAEGERIPPQPAVEAQPATTATAAPRRPTVLAALAKPLPTSVTLRERPAAAVTPYRPLDDRPVAAATPYKPSAITPYERPAVAVTPYERPVAIVASYDPVAAYEPPATDSMPPPRPPAAIGQALPGASTEPSFISRTIDKTVKIKDGVVSVTQRVAAAIGSIPSFITGGGPSANSSSAGHLVSATW